MSCQTTMSMLYYIFGMHRDCCGSYRGSEYWRTRHSNDIENFPFCRSCFNEYPLLSEVSDFGINRFQATDLSLIFSSTSVSLHCYKFVFHNLITKQFIIIKSLRNNINKTKVALVKLKHAKKTFHLIPNLVISNE